MIRAALDDYARTRTRQFDADRSQTVGASEVGQCARKVFYLKNEADPVCGAQRDLDFADGWGARLRGTVFEDQVWTPALRAKFNSQLLFAGDEQRTLVSGFVSATPDALLIEQPRECAGTSRCAGHRGQRDRVGMQDRGPAHEARCRQA